MSKKNVTEWSLSQKACHRKMVNTKSSPWRNGTIKIVSILLFYKLGTGVTKSAKQHVTRKHTHKTSSY
jgi:hypothetical protein